jgi:hypothetical protein
VTAGTNRRLRQGLAEARICPNYRREFDLSNELIGNAHQLMVTRPGSGGYRSQSVEQLLGFEWLSQEATRRCSKGVDRSLYQRAFGYE